MNAAHNTDLKIVALVSLAGLIVSFAAVFDFDYSEVASLNDSYGEFALSRSDGMHVVVVPARMPADQRLMRTSATAAPEL
jgi:hypothetical protein